MKIAIACDPAGQPLKGPIEETLAEMGVEYVDLGIHEKDPRDYPIFAVRAANAVLSGECDRGIILCGTGVGISMAANKVKGIRAAVVTNAFCAQATRQHNDSNILCMGGRVISEVEAVEFTKIFLNTEFEGGRHERRVQQITAIENGEL